MTTIDVSTDLLEDYRQDGFTIIPGVLSPEEVRNLRSACHAEMTRSGKQEMLPTAFVHNPIIWNSILRRSVTQAVKGAIGTNARLYPNLTVRKSLYIGWHIDEAFVGAGREHVWRPGFSHLQGAIYLQDNSEEFGGGIDVVPGSHRMSLDGYGRIHPDYEAALNSLPPEQQPVRVDSKAGDLVLWHARTWHASTAGTSEAARTNKETEKLGVFFSAGRANLYENNRFLSHLVTKQVQYENGESVRYPRHAEVLNLRYPTSFPTDFCQNLDELDIEMATFDAPA